MRITLIIIFGSMLWYISLIPKLSNSYPDQKMNFVTIQNSGSIRHNKFSFVMDKNIIAKLYG